MLVSLIDTTVWGLVIPRPKSADVVHARFAYFFRPGCDAGLAEVMRVLRPGGTLVFIGNDLRAGQFADLLRAAAGALVPAGGEQTEAWWAERGADRTTVRSSWRFTTRADFEAVLRMEFPRKVADPWLAAHPGALGLSYSYALFAIDKPACSVARRCPRRDGMRHPVGADEDGQDDGQPERQRGAHGNEADQQPAGNDTDGESR